MRSVGAGPSAKPKPRKADLALVTSLRDCCIKKKSAMLLSRLFFKKSLKVDF